MQNGSKIFHFEIFNSHFEKPDFSGYKIQFLKKSSSHLSRAVISDKITTQKQSDVTGRYILPWPLLKRLWTSIVPAGKANHILNII
jgi:hypothetical protein